MPSLSDLQKRLAAVFTHPGGVKPGLARAGFHHEKDPVTAVVADRPPVPLHTRLAVYSDAYFLRLSECLGQDFRAVKRAAGEEGFQRLAADYLMRHPSRSPFINDAGGAFPPFLKKHPVTKTMPFLPELAALEWAALRALLIDRLPAGGLDRAGPGSRLRLDPTARLLTTEWAVDRLWKDRGRDDGEGLRRLKTPSPRRLLLWRDDVWVRVRALSKEEFLLAQKLAGGDTLASALRGLPIAPPALRRIFARWTRDGVLKGLR